LFRDDDSLRTWGAAVLRPYKLVANVLGRAGLNLNPHPRKAEVAAPGFARDLADMGRSMLRPYKIAASSQFKADFARVV
jgi:hypothetical protein